MRNPLRGVAIRGVATLTYVLIAFFIVDGFMTVSLAMLHRRELSARWEGMMVNGFIDLILASIVISGLQARSSGHLACSWVSR